MHHTRPQLYFPCDEMRTRGFFLTLKEPPTSVTMEPAGMNEVHPLTSMGMLGEKVFLRVTGHLIQTLIRRSTFRLHS